MAQPNIHSERKPTRVSPSGSAASNEFESKSRTHLTLAIPPPENYAQSSAERYILSRSQMLNNPVERQDSSPDTPSSITGSHVSALPSPMSYNQRMHQWHQEQNTRIRKKHKHQYVYGHPPPSSPMRLPSPSNVSPASPTTNNQPSTAHENSTEKPKSFFRKFL